MDLLNVEMRLANPMKFRNDLLNFLGLDGQKISLDKYIAGVKFQHSLPVVGQERAVFFGGTFDEDFTNIRNSFTRPESEPTLIYGMRIWQNAVVAANRDITPWDEVTDGDLQNGDLTIENNGKTQLRNYPINEALTAQTGKFQSYIPLLELINWKGQTSLNVIANFKVAPVTLLLNMRVELLGIGLIS